MMKQSQMTQTHGVLTKSALKGTCYTCYTCQNHGFEMPPPTKGGGWRHYVFRLSVCPSVTQIYVSRYLPRELMDLHQT